MRNILFIIFCFFIIKSGFSQDTFTYKTVNASDTKESVIQLEGPTEQTTTSTSKPSSVTSKGGGTVTNGISGALSVSQTGGANYTVPIDVLPGLNGVQPEIALTFDSQTGDGIAGWGWHLSGISSITRTPTTQYHDGFIDPVDFDDNDRFALDGQRLILKSGAYGENGAVYQTEQYSNLKIVSYGTHPDTNINGPQYFKVFYPDGSIAHYGFNDDSRKEMDYAISYWENPQGIRINYEYYIRFSQAVIYKIKYGNRGSQQTLNEIRFNYLDKLREDKFLNSGKLLKSIVINGGKRTYSISHSTTSLNYHLLTEIKETSLGTHRAPITFIYDSSPQQILESENSFNQLNLGNIEQRNAGVVTLDMSGNGKMDFIVYPKTGADTKKKFWLFNDFQLGGLSLGTEVNTGLFEDIFPVSWLNYQNKLLNNQGLAVIQNHAGAGYQVKFKVYSSGGAAQPIAYKYEKIWGAPFYYENSTITRVPLKYVSGDFDGDGLSDVIALEEDYAGSSVSKAHFIKLDRRISINFTSYVGNLSNQLQPTDKLITLDFNGDGKTDIAQIRDGHIYFYTLNEANTALELLRHYTNTKLDTIDPILPGDYNGDGKSDILFFTGEYVSDFNVVMWEETGFGGYGSGLYNPVNAYSSYQDGDTFYGYNLLPVDINSDGKTDIIDFRTTTYENQTDGQYKIRVYKNIAKDGDTPYINFESSSGKSGTKPMKHFPIPVFIKSDKASNNNLEFAFISDNRVNSFEFTKDHKVDVSLKTITSNGVSTKIKYDQVNPNYQDPNDPFYSSSYSPSYGQIYPYVNVNIAPSFKVVRELTETGDNITRTKKFLYTGAISNTSGLGFIGFQELKQTNWYGDGVGTLWSVSKHDPMLRNAITEQWVAETSSSSPGQYVSKTNYFYDYTLIANPGSPSAPQYTENIIRNTTILGQETDTAEQTITLKEGFHALGSNGTYWGKLVPPEEQPGASGYAGVSNLRLDKIESNNGLTGVFTTETYTYNAYNNPITTYKTFPGGSNTLTLQYSNNAGATNNTYHIGRPTKKAESNTLSGNTFSTEEQYSYNNNLISETKIKGNGTSWLTTAFQYDVNGNVTQKTISADGVPSRTEQFEYVGYGQRFLTKSIDTEGLETTFTYDAITGNLLTTTNPYSFVTTFEYDKWDRLEKETDYLGKETLYAYLPQTGGGLKKTTDYATGSKDETLYNAFGWVIKSGALSLDNQWVYKNFEYDVSGRKTRESEPYTGGASQWNTIGYDQYGRVISQALFNGKTISTTYSNLSSTVNDGTKTVTTTADALGNVVKVQDPGGTINYTHYANGSMKTADYSGNVVSTTIDGWGRKVSLNDPSAGNYTYSYNNYGKLLEETSPKGTTTYVYDAYGKPTSKEMSGDLTDHVLTYQYDNTTKLLTSINGQDNTNTRAYSYQYTYDTYKRPNTIKENTGLAEFELQYTYDTYGRVHKETQIAKNLANAVSSTITTRNVYDASGILSEIWNDGTTDKLWELDAINARGQALTINLGNGMAKTKIYDTYGYITKIEDKETGSNPTPTVALHTTYSFNQQRGSLTSRNNVGFSHQENFGYDNLDRLTTIGGAVTKTMTYDTRGRITNNTSIGDYVYDNTVKYRLKEITPNATGETYFQQHPTQQISYNAFKKPIDIHETGHGRVSFEYGPMMNRSHAYYGGDNADKLLLRYRKHYSAITGSEIVEDTQTSSTKIITYISGDAYTAPIAHIKTTGTGAINEYHYLHRDYLGSILAITDADGDVMEERQFGAWGSVDKFLDSNGGTVFNHQSLLGRGYTGHEHFFEVALIHMNGRMYDAQLGRFLSPDNYIQEPFNTQNYNRYGYVLNNPLMYTDPTGELFGGGRDSWLSGLGSLIFSGLKSLFGGYDPSNYGNQGGNQGGNQFSAAIPTNNNTVRSSYAKPRTPNPDYTFDSLGSQDNTSLLDGYNRTIRRFNNNFWGSFQDFMGKPIQGAVNYINRATLGVAQLAHDAFPGLSGVTGIENKTGNAIVGVGETISNIPNMTNEQRGNLLGGASIFAMQFFVTRKMSSGNIAAGFSNINRAGTIIKQTSKKADYLFSNRSDAMNWARKQLGHNTNKMYDSSGKWIGWNNSKGSVYWGHGDWGKGVGSSTFPHINYKIGNKKGHLFLQDKITNKGMWDSFINYFSF